MKVKNIVLVLKTLSVIGAVVLAGCGGGSGGSGGSTAAGVRTQIGGAIQGQALNLTTAVTTVAGTAGTPGYKDAVGTAALFNHTFGITTDGANLYLVEYSNHTVRKIVIATGEVTTLAGSTTAGFADGTGTAAQFNTPSGITISNDGTSLYVSDTLNNAVRKVVIATGVVTTVATGFNRPHGITTDGTNLYVANTLGLNVVKVPLATGIPSSIASGITYPGGITTDGTNLFVVGQGDHKVYKIDIATNALSTVAGSGTAGYSDATGTAAQFNYPEGITTDGVNLYVADVQNQRVRKIVIATGVVSTVAGQSTAGTTDGIGALASFTEPIGITTDGTNLFVEDFSGYTIRKIQ